jgi:hypothetical protein
MCENELGPFQVARTNMFGHQYLSITYYGAPRAADVVQKAYTCEARQDF